MKRGLNEDAQHFVTTVAEGAKYHSLDAATSAAKASFAVELTDASTERGTWPNMESSGRVKKSCFELHPGRCQTKQGPLQDWWLREGKHWVLQLSHAYRIHQV